MPRFPAVTFPLSYQQQSMWLLAQLVPETEQGALNLCYEFRFQGRLDVAALQEAIRRLVKRHSVLGAHIYEKGGRFWQVIGASVEMAVRDLRGRDDAAIAADVCAASEARRKFDVDGAVLANFELLILGDQDYRLLVNVHHVIADGRSIEILRRDVAMLYSAIVTSVEPELPPEPAAYSEFVAAQLATEEQIGFEPHEEYWINELSSGPRMLKLQPDYPPRGRRSFRGSQFTAKIDESLMEACRRQSFRWRVPLSVFMLAAFVKLLMKVSHQSDIVIGTSFSGRRHDSSWRESIGLYANTVPLRFRQKATRTSREFVKHVNEKYVRAYEHQEYPLQLLLARLPMTRHMKRPSLFPIAFNFQSHNGQPVSWAGVVQSEFQRIHSLTTVLELVLHITAGTETSATVDYCTDLYSRATVITLTDEFSRILRQLSHDEVDPRRELRTPSNRHSRRVGA